MDVGGVGLVGSGSDVGGHHQRTAGQNQVRRRSIIAQGFQVERDGDETFMPGGDGVAILGDRETLNGVMPWLSPTATIAPVGSDDIVTVCLPPRVRLAHPPAEIITMIRKF